MARDLDVIIGGDAGPLPIGIAVGRFRQGAERRPVQRLQQFGAAVADLAHDLGVDGRDTRADRDIQFGQRAEAMITELCQNEA